MIEPTEMSGTMQPAHAAFIAWRGIDHAIDSAHFAHDRTALQSLMASLGSDDTPWGRYYSALAQFLMACLPGTDPADGIALARSALQAVDDCEATAVQMQVERLVLSGSICGLIAKLSSGQQRARVGGRAMTDLNQAVKLGPDNPRGIFSQARAALGMARPGGRDAEEAFVRVRHSMSLFDTPASACVPPNWGRLQVLLFIAETHRRRGEIVLAQHVHGKLLRAARPHSYPAVADLGARIANS
jgi:hypothetical protein